MTVMKAFVVVAVALAVVSLIPSANADFYIQHPRGSNNKLNEQNNNRRNQNRLFDSQNNANAGYNVGDECDGICHPDPLTRTYDSTIPGAGEGEMKYYENSYLYIEWTAQHGCGNENENTYCDIVFQFLCDDEVRNGRITPTNNGANNPDVAPLDRELAQSWDYGRHESWEFYYNCSHRIRNRGLFFGTLPNNIEDRQEENRDYAVYTRQDNNGPNDDGNGRYGFECPEERDYYPYWHPTEWIDIVVLTSSPARCGMYRSESQNVMNKGTCSNTLYNNPDACVGVDPVTGRQSNGTWEEQPSWDDIEDLDELFPDFPFDDIDAPPCEGTAWSRDNHHGNGLDGQMAHYMWQLPELKDGVDEARCVLRGRYNNTSDDYPGWETFSEANADPPIKGNPNADFLKVGVCLDSNDNEVRHYTSEECLNDLDDDYRWIPRERELRLAQNPAQFSRVFEDRTHMFKIIARPPGIADVTPIYNLNVRGRRGNIQQTYPAVEYDFTPPNLVVEQNSYIHFQWTGSDSNPNNAGQGRERTDRSNLVQIESLNKNFPIPYADNTMFKTGLLGGPDYEVIDRLAFLGQPAQNCCVKCNNDEKNDDEAEPPRCCNRENTLANDEQDFRFCGLMHMAPAYFNGGLVKMYAVGTFHFMSTRNNAYTNRSQKGTITVRVDPKIVWGVVGGIAGVAGVAAALTAAAYVYGAAHEASMCATCFTLSCRKFPCCCLCYFRTPQRALKEEEEAIAAQEKSSFRRWLAENNLKLKWLALYIVLNIGIGLYGFCTNYFIQGWSNLFRKDNTVPIWFPLAKTGGAILNLNCSLILLPVLRNFISWLRLTPLSSHIPLDSNIGFHKLVAFFIFLGSTIHVVFHYINFVSQRVSDSVPLYTTALNWAGATGHLILLGMILIFSTAAFSKIRRGRCGCKRGFDLFFNVHKLYVPIFILLWTHGQKFWLWSMWPIGLFVIEKVIRHVRSRSTTKLVSCKWVQSDVIRIRFSVKQFNYTPGQYLYINCPSVSKNEWHPFTITSAPEDDYVECHIKCKGHWTVPFGNLMVNTYNHWKKTDGSGSGSGSGSSSSVAITQNKHTVTDALDVPITTIPIRAREALGNPEIDPTMDLVRVDGPYGSASEYVFDYPVVVLVGAGIGVTPFASIMKAIKIRIKQRHCGECRARHDHSMEKEIFPKRVYFHWMCRSKEEFLWFAFLLNSIKDDGAISDIFDFKTYMTGGLDLETFRANIIRQHNAKKGKGKGGSSSGSGSGSYTEAQESYASSLSYPTTVSGSVEITEQEEEEEEGKSKSGKKKDSSGTSSESEMAQLMQDEFLNVSNIGRPKFVKIFSDLKKKVPKGTEVGIFLCGPEAVAQAISKATFAVNTYKEGDTMFTFHKENF